MVRFLPLLVLGLANVAAAERPLPPGTHSVTAAPETLAEDPRFAPLDGRVDLGSVRLSKQSLEDLVQWYRDRGHQVRRLGNNELRSAQLFRVEDVQPPLILAGLMPAQHTQGEHKDHTSVGPFLYRLLRSADACSDELGYYMFQQEHDHLAWAFYPFSDERGENGQRLAMPEAIFRRCKKTVQKHQALASLTLEGLRLAHKTGHEDVYAHWERCIETLASHAYPSAIAPSR